MFAPSPIVSRSSSRVVGTCCCTTYSTLLASQPAASLAGYDNDIPRSLPAGQRTTWPYVQVKMHRFIVFGWLRQNDTFRDNHRTTTSAAAAKVSVTSTFHCTWWIAATSLHAGCGGGDN